MWQIQRGIIVSRAPFDPAGGGGPFTPASLSGIIGWWKADAGAYTDAGSTLATNGQTVQQWNDQSGAGNHLTQATSGKRPTYNTSQLNSLPGITFATSAAGGLAAQALSLGGTTASVFVVTKSNISSGGNERIVSFTATSAAQDFDNTPSGIFAYQSASDKIAAYRNGLKSQTAASLTTAVFRSLGSIYDGTNHTFYTNGTGETPVGSTGSFASTGAFCVGAYVGSPPGSTSFTNSYDGVVCEVILTTSALNSTDRSNIATYFNTRYGI